MFELFTNSGDPDESLGSVASDLGLHFNGIELMHSRNRAVKTKKNKKQKNNENFDRPETIVSVEIELKQ